MNTGKLKYLLLVSCLLLTVEPVWAQQLVAAEYFFDEDPGVGSGQRINLETPTASFTLKDLEVSVEGLAQGVHLLGFRALDDQENWGLTQTTRFYIEVPAARPVATKITAGEFFVDEDPGTGLGIPFSLVADTVSFRQSLEYAVGSLPVGPHRLGIRLKDTQNRWGLTGYTRFLVQQPTVQYVPPRYEIDKIAYFLDTLHQPLGTGKMLVPELPDFTITVSDSIDLDTTAIAPGRHYLKVRALDASGTWGLTYFQPFDFCFPEGIAGGFGLEQTLNQLTLTDSSTNAVEYIYDLGNGDSLFTADAMYTYPQGGNYEVCQTVYSFCDTVISCKSILVPTPRVKDSIPDVTILEDTPTFALSSDLELVFEDPDGDPLTFAAVSGNDSLLVEIMPDRSLWLTATENFYGESFISIAATGGGITAYDTVLVKVLSVNDFPEFTEEVYDQAYDEDTGPRVVFNDVKRLLIDVEDDSLLYQVSSDNPGILPSIDSRRRFLIDMAEDFVGSGNVTLSATDDSAAVTSRTINVLIVPIPDAPKLLQPLPDFQILEDAGSVTLLPDLAIYFSDPENDPITYEVANAPAWMNLTVENSALQITTAADAFGSAEVVVLASDGGLIGSDTVLVEVLPVNDAPRFLETEQLWLCDGLLSLPIDSLIFDPEHSTSQLNITWEVVAAMPTASVLSLQHSGNTLFFNGGEAQFDLRFTVSDPEGKSTEQRLALGNFIATIQQEITTLVANEGESYQWLRDGQPIEGAVQQQFVVTARGNYQVRVGQDGCQAISEGVTVTALQQEAKEAFHLFPNPATDELRFSFPSSFTGPAHVQVIDLTGKVLIEQKVQPLSENTLSVGDLPQGLYLLRLKAANGEIVRKWRKGR